MLFALRTASAACLVHSARAGRSLIILAHLFQELADPQGADRRRIVLEADLRHVPHLCAASELPADKAGGPVQGLARVLLLLRVAEHAEEDARVAEVGRNLGLR